MVAVVTPQHVIIANAGDSRAILIMVPSRGRAGPAGAGAGTKREIQWRSGKTDVPAMLSRGPTNDVEEKDETAAAVAQRFAAALGLNVEGDDGSGFGSEGVNSPEAADAAGLNDSVRLEEMEEDDNEGGDVGDLGLDDEDAAKIRQLLSAMMSGDSAVGGLAVGAAARGATAGDDGGEGKGDGTEKRGKGSRNESGVEILGLSRDHTANDEREKDRVEAAGGRAFEVRYTEEDGTEAKVRACF